MTSVTNTAAHEMLAKAILQQWYADMCPRIGYEMLYICSGLLSVSVDFCVNKGRELYHIEPEVVR